MRKVYTLPIVLASSSARPCQCPGWQEGALTAQDYVEIQMLYAQPQHR
jgi:hypothetical protein